MPKTKKIKKNGPPPEGYSKIEPTLTKFLSKLKQAQSDQDKTKSKHSSLWKVFQLNHQISRYVYDLYNSQKISRDLYDWLLLQSYVNRDLIAKWKKPGYEKLCCVQCIVEKNYGGTCICRVPKEKLIENDPEKVKTECITCGCKGCASTD
ncbi:BUD31 [[Candida] subhashii]|uniref:BUD31 n=1 Tax=[Candida] subhashii TaxID=561895 RepID=A0A8J5UND8_9ASCO|nr:BUD31 [[Candida] subhashii]KAG7663602.1 BUD31 [[Candida] subhashii]